MIPAWRNRQTRLPQKQLPARACPFESGLGDQLLHIHFFFFLSAVAQRQSTSLIRTRSMDRPHPALPRTLRGCSSEAEQPAFNRWAEISKFSTRTNISARTSSSAGRAALLHGEGPGFNASEVHHISLHGWRNRQTRDVEGVMSERTSRFEAGVVHQEFVRQDASPDRSYMAHLIVRMSAAIFAAFAPA